MLAANPTAINVRQRKAKLSKPAGLTVSQATRDARKVVNRVMPNVGATVNSKLSYDFGASAGVVITTITFPRIGNTDPRGWQLAAALAGLSGHIERRAIAADSSMVIARKVN